MNIYVGQIYIEAGINYPFSHIFQRWIHKELSNLVPDSSVFEQKYPGYNVIFNMSSKAKLTETLIMGPTVFKKNKDIEFSIFLPYLKHDRSDPNSLREPLRLLLDAIATVLRNLGADVSALIERTDSIIDHILSDSSMIKIE